MAYILSLAYGMSSASCVARLFRSGDGQGVQPDNRVATRPRLPSAQMWWVGMWTLASAQTRSARCGRRSVHLTSRRAERESARGWDTNSADVRRHMHTNSTVDDAIKPPADGGDQRFTGSGTHLSPVLRTASHRTTLQSDTPHQPAQQRGEEATVGNWSGAFSGQDGRITFASRARCPWLFAGIGLQAERSGRHRHWERALVV